ncbi:MAG: PDZ domain-containing protein, partial [Actinobacteria bacterium]|nr:PDZ domain-containing protein [Actinomycetota bacterium]
PARPGTDGAPVPTMLIARGGLSSASPATAVALTPGHFVVTTALAVRGRQGLEVRLPNGQTVVSAVVLLDEASGTAVLAVPDEIDASVVQLSPESGQAAAQATGIVMTSSEPLSVNVVRDSTGVHLLYNRDVHPGEGALVLDRQGRLLGMCTMADTGATLITVATMLDALEAAAALEAPAWIGIQPSTTPGTAVHVASVISDGPAAMAGVRAGDTIVAINGIPITNLDDLGQAVAAHSAGDSIAVTVARPGGPHAITITITLSKRPVSM